ncbi:MAG: HDIG domain-containing protein [Spirochaetaceae bacterium]|nr:HDIG domain-containing protein [Spirochaetaceae bacterium]MBQ8560594.1 HDIG domain-containing protein [Spirochaetaceae bacterium]
MKKEKAKKNWSSFSYIKDSISQTLAKNYGILLVFLGAFLACVLISFFVISSTETVMAYSASEFEVGQIADKTIVSDVSLPPDAAYPFSVEEGEKIVRKGFPVTEIGLSKLEKLAAAPEYIDYKALSDGVLFLMLLAAMTFFLFNPIFCGTSVSLKEAILLAVFFVATHGLAGVGSLVQPFNQPYNLPIILPCTLFVLLVTVMFSQTHGVIFSFILSLGVLNAHQENIIPSLFVLASCLASTRVVRSISRRIEMVFSSLLIGMLNLVFMLTLKIVFLASFSSMIFTLLMVSLNGFISGILALGFLTPLESLLNTASAFRLMELGDTRNAVLEALQTKAAGTYSHSMMVSQLAEKACRAIGANDVLARVGALYHDMGKMDQSEYFVENQSGENKHDGLKPSMSASILRGHLKKGIEKAEQMRLPKEVIDIIAEHHGNSVIKGFYAKAKTLDPNVSPEEFRYSGNPPSSKESAVVMLADTVEAACHTLEKPSVPNLEVFIHQLVMDKLEHGQLDNANITFKELARIEKVFVDVLAGYYHSRIKYPDQKELEEESRAEEKVAT